MHSSKIMMKTVCKHGAIMSNGNEVYDSYNTGRHCKSYIAELEALTKALVVNLRQKRSAAVLLTYALSVLQVLINNKSPTTQQ